MQRHYSVDFRIYFVLNVKFALCVTLLKYPPGSAAGAALPCVPAGSAAGQLFNCGIKTAQGLLASQYFGKLHGELELQPGMNLLCLPNEAGKSTWSAFLLAMLYGIDTSERLTKNKALPAKERYKPWDGSAMEGSMELEWNGRHIAIERTSTARAPSTAPSPSALSS